MVLTEPQTRKLAANIVAALHVRSHGEFIANKINITENGSGVTVQIELRGTGLIVECRIPSGHFSYDAVADEFIRAITNSTLDTKGDPVCLSLN